MSIREALRRAPLVEQIPGLHLLAVGHGWDAVRVPREVGFPALALLRSTGTALGPVLYDRPGDRLYYAIRPGDARSWQAPVRLLSTGSWLVAPGPYQAAEWFGGWCELPDDGTLTDPGILRTALKLAQAEAVSHARP
ncbi:hypothetical protein ACFWM5_10715 [Streptomyces bobili]|uniref:hypothetical protein n=1 Tax=Streptomyces bobili TaxID=67280 RepID=UPI0036579CEE